MQTKSIKRKETPTNQDYQFFREAVHAFSGSLLLPEVMQTTFDFLKQYFPIDAVSLHKFDSPNRSMHNLFLVTKDGFQYLDIMIPIPAESIATILKLEKKLKIVNNKRTVGLPPAEAHNKAVSSFLPEKDRARLIAILTTPKEVVGHFSLVGKSSNCFTKEHERKLMILWPILGLFMLNLLQFHEISELKNRLAERNRYLVGRLRYLNNRMIVGEESGLRFVKEMITHLSGQDIPVLITGETGTGKELIADAVHQVSTRYQEPYVKVNCGAIPDTLIDSELFGHEKGAFTGANRVRYGRFEQAKGGTLFLDEIGDMPLNAQVRLLRVLQDGIFERVGGSAAISGDVRIIAASHHNLAGLVRVGKFRQDLFYRLNVFPIHVPPLRERVQDIPALANHFITKKARQLSLTNTPLIAPESLSRLQSYHWPGNVRELENLVERALALDPQGPLKLHHYLPPHKTEAEEAGSPIPNTNHWASGPSESDISSRSLPDSVDHAKKNMPTLDQAMTNCINEALILCNGQISGYRGAARLLGINPNTLRKRMGKLKIPYGRQT